MVNPRYTGKHNIKMSLLEFQAQSQLSVMWCLDLLKTVTGVPGSLLDVESLPGSWLRQNLKPSQSYYATPAAPVDSCGPSCKLGVKVRHSIVSGSAKLSRLPIERAERKQECDVEVRFMHSALFICRYMLIYGSDTQCRAASVDTSIWLGTYCAFTI